MNGWVIALEIMRDGIGIDVSGSSGSMCLDCVHDAAIMPAHRIGR